MASRTIKTLRALRVCYKPVPQRHYRLQEAEPIRIADENPILRKMNECEARLRGEITEEEFAFMAGMHHIFKTGCVTSFATGRSQKKNKEEEDGGQNQIKEDDDLLV